MRSYNFSVLPISQEEARSAVCRPKLRTYKKPIFCVDLDLCQFAVYFQESYMTVKKFSLPLGQSDVKPH